MSMRRDLAASLVFLALGALVCVGASRLGFGSVRAPEPGFFPWLGGLTLAGLSAALLTRAWRSPGAAAVAAREWSRPAMLLGALVLYVPMLEPLGYPLATAALCVVALRILAVRRWSVAFGVSVGLAIATFVLFRRGLGVELPAGVLAFLG